MQQINKITNKKITNKKTKIVATFLDPKEYESLKKIFQKVLNRVNPHLNAKESNKIKKNKILLKLFTLI